MAKKRDRHKAPKTTINSVRSAYSYSSPIGDIFGANRVCLRRSLHGSYQIRIRVDAAHERSSIPETSRKSFTREDNVTMQEVDKTVDNREPHIR